MRSPRALLAGLVALALALTVTACADSSDPVDDPDTEPTPTGTPSPEAVSFTVTSPAFVAGDEIPPMYANLDVDGGQNVSLPLDWSDLPEGTASIALVMMDRHPVANEWIHWMVVNIPPDSMGLEEGASGAAMPPGVTELENTWGDVGYGGPAPPPGTGAHEYEITVYALDTAQIELASGAGFTGFLEAVAEHMLGSATVSGLFER